MSRAVLQRLIMPRNQPLPYSELGYQYYADRVGRGAMPKPPISRVDALQLTKPGTIEYLICAAPTERMTMGEFCRTTGLSESRTISAISRLWEKYSVDIEFLPPAEVPAFVDEFNEVV